MDIISIKLDESLNKEMEQVMKPYYTTKTEFIREAIRDKIREEKHKKYVQKVWDNLGKGKHLKTTDEDIRNMKKEAFEEFIKEKDWKSN